jgi:sugar phosphate permease
MTRPSDSPGTPDRWLVLLLAALSYFTLYLHRNLVNYLQPPIKASLEASNEQIGMLSTAFLLPYTLVQVGVGFLSDRFSRRVVLLFSLFSSALALGLSGLVWYFEELLFLRVALALAQSASVPAIASLIADSFTPKSRSLAIGIYLASYNISLVVAGRYGGKVADTPMWELPFDLIGLPAVRLEGWRVAMLLFALVGAICALLVLGLLREPVRTEAKAGQSQRLTLGAALRLVLQVPTFWSLGAIFALQLGVVAAIQFWLPRLLRERFHLSLEDSGWLATIWVQSATIAGLFAGGWLADRLAQRWKAGRTMVQMTGLALVAPAVVLVGRGTDLEWLALPMVMFGVGTGMYQASLWAGTFEVVDPAARATAIGLLNVASGVCSSWWNVVIGLAVDQGTELGDALVFLGGPAALAAGLLLLNALVLLPRDYRGPLQPKAG